MLYHLRGHESKHLTLRTLRS